MEIKDLPTELYKILNTETNEFWETYNGKGVWNKPAHAKQAWSASSRIRPSAKVKFNDQSKYVIMKFTTDNWLMEEYK